jgi:hypothetical protein
LWLRWWRRSTAPRSGLFFQFTQAGFKLCHLGSGAWLPACTTPQPVLSLLNIPLEALHLDPQIIQGRTHSRQIAPHISLGSLSLRHPISQSLLLLDTLTLQS